MYLQQQRVVQHHSASTSGINRTSAHKINDGRNLKSNAVFDGYWMTRKTKKDETKHFFLKISKRSRSERIRTNASNAAAQAQAASVAIVGLSSMKKADLVELCERKGIDATGTVPVLRQRLRDVRDGRELNITNDEDDNNDKGDEEEEAVDMIITKNKAPRARFSVKDEVDEEEQDALARKLALELAVEADATRAKDVRVLQVSKAVFYARYIVLATAFNRPQMQAVTSKMRDVANSEQYNLDVPKNVGNQGDWTCLDCKDVVAHVFTPTSRSYYDLEDLYRECDDVQLPFETERMHDGFYAEESPEFYEEEDEDETEELEDEFEINWSEK
jgi:ribosome silencing factor RsfS/YbeB/iojap